jgi:hypothetical protein
MTDIYFTFGSGHHDKNHASLTNCYTIISAEDENAAREIMHERRGSKYCTSYTELHGIQVVEKWGMTLIPFDEINEQVEENN